ncbi:MAG: transposase [Isosphaeraceae bacterium]
MPAYARRDIVDEDRVGVYHCIARCVRGAFLCGTDSYKGRDYGHRKAWVLDRLRQLAGLFGVEVCDYAIMSNHLHIVLRNRPDVARQWSDDEVAIRWRKLFPQRDELTGEPREPDRHDVAMLTADADRLAILRSRLASLSWFMRCWCEWVARKANHEEGSFGRFWAGRFKSQPLLDESALLACSVYVDLNPVRAGIAATPEESQFTSGFDRIHSLAEHTAASPSSSRGVSGIDACGPPEPWLCELTLQETDAVSAVPRAEHSLSSPRETAPAADPTIPSRHEPEVCAAPFASGDALPPIPLVARSGGGLRARASDQGFLPIDTQKYIMLLDWTGREIRENKCGAIPDNLAPILDRLGLDRSNWVKTVREFGRMFKQAAGRASSLARAAPGCSRRWFQGKAAAQAAFV